MKIYIMICSRKIKRKNLNLNGHFIQLFVQNQIKFFKNIKLTKQIKNLEHNHQKDSLKI